MAVEVARANGWTAETEVAEGDDWRADVLARKGTAKVAVEIQWSPQVNEVTLQRQARYAKAGVRCLWLLRQRGVPVDPALPAARIGGSVDEGFVAHVLTGGSEQSIPMRDFLNAAFSHRLRFGVPLGFTATVTVRAGRMFCWKCGAETQIITSVDVLLRPHEYRFSVPDLSDYPDLFDRVHAHLPKHLLIGALKRRYSKTQGRFYLSNGCAHCDVLLGEFYEHEAWHDAKEVCAFSIRIDHRWSKALEAKGETGWAVYLLE